MKNLMWNGKLMAVAGMLIMSFICLAMAQAEDDHPGTLRGTWVVTVTQRDCTSGAQLSPPFLSLLTFNKGGTMTEATSNPMFFPSERGPGHGVWRAAGHRQYSASTIALITLNGTLTTVQTITQTIEIGSDPDTFQTTKATVDFLTPGGTLIRSGCATASGARFQ